MKRPRGFPPIADRRARVLILGSMPGEASLAAGEYYAYRHNQFWRIAGVICGFAPDAPYARRTAALKRHGIALTRLESEGFGPNKPIADNNTDEGRARNRRVEFKILSE